MDRKLLVTGASSDMGVELIKSVLDDYDRILAHYNHWNDKLEALKNEAGEKIAFLQADFSDAESVEKMLCRIMEEGIEPDHIVLLTSPKLVLQKFVKTEFSRFTESWNSAIQPDIMILQALLPRMLKQKYGKVIFMLTAYTVDVLPQYASAYAMEKYALLGLMKSLAAEYKSRGIAVNGVSPDMMHTKFLDNLPRLMLEQYAENRPDKRLLVPADVVPTFKRLLSDEGEFITGENISVM